jgi:FkbM family methyltransferase
MLAERRNAAIQYPPSIISYAQNGEDVILNRIFMGKKKGFYIDVGAGRPDDDSVTKAFYELGWNGINIEPHPVNFEPLNIKRARDINLPIGISIENDLKPFYLLKTNHSWGMSSFDKKCIQGLTDDLYDVRKIKTQRLTKVIDDFAPNEIIDFLKIDVEGYEYEVLSSLDFDKYKPRVLVIESVFPGSSTPSRSSWIELVEKYYVHALFDGINDYYVLPKETFLFNQLGSMVNLFDGVDNRISADKLRIEVGFLKSGNESLKNDNDQLKDINKSFLNENTNLNTKINEISNYSQTQSADLLRLRKLIYQSNFSTHLYRSWRVLKNDPHYTIDSLLPKRQSTKVSFGVHAKRFFKSLFRIYSKPWHTHLYRCLRNLIGDQNYRVSRTEGTSIRDIEDASDFCTNYESKVFNEINLKEFQTEETPLLSICISTYNRSDWLKLSLTRLLSIVKSYSNLIEVVVCDNASTDNTHAVILELSHNYDFIHKRNDYNIGMLGNLSETANLASGKFVWVIGDDDHINTDCLEHILKVILIYPCINIIYTNYSFTHYNNPNTEIDELERSQQLISPVSKSRYVEKLSSVAANTPNFFTAIYCCIFKNNHAKKCYNQDTSGRPFSSLLTCVPTTFYTLNNLLEKPAYWYGSPAILINMNVSWLKYADLWVLERFPEMYKAFQDKGVSLTKINQYRRESIDGVLDHLERYLDVRSENLDIINLEMLFSTYRHLDSFKDALPRIKDLISKYPSFKNNINYKTLTCSSDYNIRVEGPFVGSYSLSQVNRGMACNLDLSGYDVILSPSPTEGENFRIKRTQLDSRSYDLYQKSLEDKNLNENVILRYTFPPTIDQMDGEINMYHSFGWEESKLPHEHVENLNQLDSITVMSSFVKRALEESGVSIPIYLTGLGIDQIFFDEKKLANNDIFNFLHISSCFDRKGVDILLKSYFNSFCSKDKVNLIIKTFPNPHNRIHEMLFTFREEFKSPPNVTIINEDWEDSKKLKNLYESCDVLIAPSRGEGFCLPIGEALLSGIPIIATAWGGQIDMLGLDYPWLIDFKFAKATSHLSEGDSYWVEPCEISLGNLLKVSYKSSKSYRSSIVQEWSSRVGSEFTWENTVNRLANALSSTRAMISNKSIEPNLLAVLTPWDKKCGIYEYSKNLLSHFNNLKPRIYSYNCTDDKTSSGNNNICNEKCFDENPRFQVKAKCFEGYSKILIHHQPSFFTQKQFLKILQIFVEMNKDIFIIVHNVRNFVDQFSLDYNSILRTGNITLFVHSINDLNLLKEKEIGILFNTVHMSHGIIDHRDSSLTQNFDSAGYLVISTFGFLLPNKGVYELIECFSILKSMGLKIKLNLFTSLLDERSVEYFEKCNSLIKEKMLNEDVNFCTQHLEISELLSNLANSNLIILPYTDSTESCSGALRTCLSAKRPIICSNAAIFDDVRHIVNSIDCTNSEHMSQGLLEIIHNKVKIDEQFIKQISYTESNKWEIVAQRFQSVMRSRSKSQN